MGHSNRSRVPLTAKQEREIEQLGCWVEPNAWTHRMLTALVTGVKGGKFVRQRLRGVLRYQSKRKGYVRYTDGYRWRNAYFERQGLVSLTAAHDQLRQSSRR